MDNDNMPKLGLVGEIGHSEDILAMLDKCDSESSEVEDDSQELFESSDIDDILDDYTPVADFDDSRATGSQIFVAEEPEDLTQRRAIVTTLSQTSIMSYVSSSSSQVEQRSQECVQLPSRKDKHVLKSDVNRNLGRPKNLIREQFTTSECGRKARCADCGLEVSNRVDVMKNHYNNRRCKARKNRESPPSIHTLSQTSIPNLSCQASAPQVASAPHLASAAYEASAPQLASEPSSPLESLTSSQSSEKTSQASVVELSSASLGASGFYSVKRRFENWEEAPPSKKKLRQFFDKLSSTEKSKIDIQVGKMIFGCNLPFAVVENPEFRELMKMLRPAYDAPNRKRIGQEILEEVYDEVKCHLTNAVADKDVTLIQDGWSTTQTQPVIAHSFQVGSKAYFLNAVSPGVATKDAEYCLTLLNSAINECESKHGCKVIGTVTDNCRVMLSLRNKLNEIRPELFVFGCNAHYLNLVAQKLIPSEKVEDIVTVQKYFKNHHFQSAALTAASGKRPIILGLTRWNSQIDCLENYIENHAIYLDILRKNPNKFHKSVADLINNFSLYTNAEALKNAAKPVAAALEKVQSNSATLSDAIAEWIKLRDGGIFLDQSALNYFESKLNEAFNETALSAFILDPRYRGRGLRSEEKQKAYIWMDQLNEDLTFLAMDLEAKNDQRFPSYLMRDEKLARIDPCTFWTVLQGHCDLEASACKLAQNLQKLPASGSSIERCFSTLRSIMTKTRNRLGIEKAGKLCTIYQSLRFMRDDET